MKRTRKQTAQLILGMGSAEYHADPAPKPSLSASIAKTIADECERKAWHDHPRLNPHWTASVPTQEMDDGTTLHTLFLRSGTEIAPIGAADWKLEWAREKRDRVRLAGKVPVLQRRLPQLQDCADSLRSELQANDAVADLFRPGDAEAVILCRLGPSKTWCRTRIDWLPHDPAAWVYDFKFTTQSAAPQEWERNVWKEYDIQAEMICRCVEQVRGRRPPGVRFVVCEMKAPYCASILTAGPDVMTRGAQRLDDAMRRWDRSMLTKVWPGYATSIGVVSLPGWMLEQVADQAYQQDVAKINAARQAKTPEPWERIRA